MLDPTTLTISPFSIGGAFPQIEAVKVTHNPTGISVTCRRHSSHKENLEEALLVLERQVNRLYKKPT